MTKNKTNMFKDFKVELEHFNLSNEDSRELDDGKFIYLFGKNGSGKTELSRQIKDKNKSDIQTFVFNKDYISKNVFVEDINKNDDKNKTKCNASNKKNTLKVFLDQKLIQNHNDLKNINEKINILKFEYNNNLFNHLINESDYSESIEYFKNYLSQDQKDKIMQMAPIEELLKKDKNIIEEINISDIKNKWNDLYKKIDEFYNNMQMVDFYILFNKLVELAIKSISLDQKIKLNKDKKNIKTYKTIEFHEIAIKLKENEEIEFLGTNYKIEEVEKYIEKYKKKIHESKKKINSDFYKEYNNIQENYYYKKLKKIERKKINDLEKFLKSGDIKSLESSKKLIEDKNKIEFFFDKWLIKNKYYLWKSYTNFESIDKEFKLGLNISFKEYYNLKDFILVWEALESKLEIINSEKEKSKEWLKERESKIKEKFNKNLKTLTNEEYSINIKIAMGNKDPSVSFSLYKKNIESLSEGEKSSFALSYFLTDLEINLKDVNKDFIIFIDDPFDSNDHYKYMNFKKIRFNDPFICSKFLGLSDFIKKVEKKKKCNAKTIISTHNINVLSSFVLSLCEHDNKFALMKMKKNYREIFYVKQITNKKSKINIKNIDVDLLFSFEKKLKLFFDSFCEMYKEKILNRQASDEEKQIFKFISCILIKINDFYCSEERVKWKNYFEEFTDDKDEFLEIEKIIRKIKTNFKSIEPNTLNKILIDFYSNFYKSKIKLDQNRNISEEGLENIIKFLILIKEPYHEIISSGDEERHKIITHKLFYSSNLIHLLED
ncbi:MAG: hypothetical protein ACRCUM_00445 [Mycoplasmoidaceae bacterium]